MKQPDRKHFINAMQTEMEDQLNNSNFSIIKQSAVPKCKITLPVVWQMKRKRNILTREIKKYKGRLNIDGSRMIKGLDNNETYAPVAKWNFIRILLIMVLFHNWKTTQIDYVLAYPQAPIEHRSLPWKSPKGLN